MRSGKKAKVEGDLIVDNLFSQERCVIDMVTEYGWKGLQCYYWEVYGNGGMRIDNGAWNYARKEYEDKDSDEKQKHWDYLKKKVTYYYYEDRNGDGKDERYSDWYYEYIYNNNGNDHPTVSGDGANLSGGGLNDQIYNHGAKNVKISGSSGNDYISNSGDDANINGGADKDTISNSGDSANIKGGTGDDSINSGGDSANIDGGADNDDIYNSGDKVTIIGGNGEGCDSVCNDGDSVEISTGAGMDSIVNNGSTITIDAGVGNDTIHSTGDSVTIDGGAGDDSIVNTVFAPFAKGGVNVTINAVEGKNTVRNGYFEGNIESHGSSYSFKFEGDHYGGDFVTIKVGAEGNVVQNHGGSHVTVDATSGGKNLISLSGGGHDISVKAGDGNDSIIAYTPERHGNHYLKPEYIANDEYSSGSDVMIETGNGNRGCW